MNTWHHHHDGEHRITFCDGVDYEDEEFGEIGDCEEWYGLICDGFLPLRHRPRMKCHYHLAFGELVVDHPEQPTLLAHLESHR